ncbi:alpha-L-rhamnosidase [Coprobacter tertius]|uniref:alpha-L-rhamnosidase n=1 Tax=Coprobacter tertius TaxID=2944915 RepID=A0ABT1MI11_9BACT|nr:alpha-L-rhamnosidase [Coprobacter tertius]MCP9612273.1 glycoside hydrolase family 78 protein [Coprobacter tertius]
MKSIYSNVLIVLLFSVAIFCCSCTSLKIGGLQCEKLSEPLSIDNVSPRFDWVLSSNKQGTKQIAYQILVASDKEYLSEKKADLWNSGKVESGTSNGILYQGHPLTSKSFSYWKVRVWDEEGKVSAWSKPACFGVGLLFPDDWSAQFIGMTQTEERMESPLLRKTFYCNTIGEKMIFHVNSLGYHEVYVNGSPISDAVLSPAVSQFDKRSLIVTYDITRFLKKGSNEIVIWLGKGWYRDGLPGVVKGGPFVRAQLECKDHGKWTTVLMTDDTWLASESGYVSTGNWRPHQFGGEVITASELPSDLTVSSLNSRKWEKVKVVYMPTHKATPQMVELNRIQNKFHPVSCRAAQDSSWIYDMGKNFTGWTKIKFPTLSPGQKIRISYCDFLDEKGQFRDGLYEDYYIASGKEGECFVNKFNYHAFRYLKLTNLGQAPALSDITGCLIHTDYSGKASFSCSDEDLNAIHDMIEYTFRCLTLGGYMVDCPQIERLGYGGDGNASTQTVQTMFNLTPLYMNWMQAWADCMRDDGGMPHTAPNPYMAGGGPYWCGFIITASWATYVNYGDSRLIERYYPYMQRWLDYVDKYSVKGLLKPWPNTDYRNWYLGDWATPSGIDQTNSLSVDVVNNCFISNCYQTMCKIADVLGKEQDKHTYTVKYKNLNTLIHKTFFNDPQKSYATGTQIDLTYPMLVGATPEEKLSDVRNTLFRVTEERFNGHLSTGLVGIPVITEWAIKNNQADFIYGMLKKKDYPGYLYMLNNGATTTWEHWNGERSHIHNCYNGIGSWFYQALGGIITDEKNPGYRHVFIQPQLVKGISWVNVSKEIPFGKLKVKWEKTNSSFMLNLSIPVGCEATVVLPVKAKSISINGEKSHPSQQLHLQSGHYHIKCVL